MTEENKTETETQEAVVVEQTTQEEIVQTDSSVEGDKTESPVEVVEELGIIESYLKNDLPEIRPGDTIKVHQIIREKSNKDRIQIFEGQVLATKHGTGISGTITVRKVISGIGVEKIFPIHSPMVSKFEIVKRTKTRRAKLYYLRTAKGRKARLKAVAFEKEAE